MLSRNQLIAAAAESGYSADSLEKVWMLVRLLNEIRAHPFLGSRVALKGGTALNLFVFDLARLSVDIDLNYIGGADRGTMMADRANLERAMEQVTGRIGLTAKKAKTGHAGGKWTFGYTSALGRPAVLEVDTNFLLRVPLWPPVTSSSKVFIDTSADDIPLLDEHELAAGKLAALFARDASRDLFDAHHLLSQRELDAERLRLGFVVYGATSRLDWRSVTLDHVAATASDVRRQLLPMLRADVRPADDDVEKWVESMVTDTRDMLAAVLPLRDNEIAFLDALNDRGELRPDLLSDDLDLLARLQSHPALLWKALNVRKHVGSGP